MFTYYAHVWSILVLSTYTLNLFFFFFTNFIYLFIYLFFVFCPFRTAPVAYGGSQARGPIGAIDTSLRQSHSNARSKPCL